MELETKSVEYYTDEFVIKLCNGCHIDASKSGAVKTYLEQAADNWHEQCQNAKLDLPWNKEKNLLKKVSKRLGDIAILLEGIPNSGWEKASCASDIMCSNRYEASFEKKNNQHPFLDIDDSYQIQLAFDPFTDRPNSIPFNEFIEALTLLQIVTEAATILPVSTKRGPQRDRPLEYW